MDIIALAFNLALLFCVAYAGIYGGRTGKAGSAILIVATILTNIAARMNPEWGGTSFSLFALHCSCLLALVILALTSDRYWPIWAVGLQTMAVATHLATLVAPDTMAKIHQVLGPIWALPILWAMVNGTRKDRQFEQGSMHAS